MTNIFDKQANQSILERLDKLTPDSEALWGKMNVAQMLLHCQKPIEVATGKLVLTGGLLGFLFGKMAKNNFLKMRGFNKSAPTHPKFKVTGEPEFEKEKQVLVSQVVAFGQLGPEAIANKKHPFFGLMSDEEWGNLMYIHLDHHLTQFNV